VKVFSAASDKDSPFLWFRDGQPQGGVAFGQSIKDGPPVFRRYAQGDVEGGDFPSDDAAKVLSSSRPRREGCLEVQIQLPFIHDLLIAHLDLLDRQGQSQNVRPFVDVLTVRFHKWPKLFHFGFADPYLKMEVVRFQQFLHSIFMVFHNAVLPSFHYSPRAAV